MELNRETPERFKVREAAYVLGCSPYTIYSHFKGQIENGLTPEQLDEIQRHLGTKGIRPYKYNKDEIQRITYYLNMKNGAQQRLEV